MSTLVADLELSLPLPTLGPLNGARGLLALVRWRGRPIGLVQLAAPGDSISASQLEAAIAAQITRPVESPEVTPPTAEPISIIACTHERPEDMRVCLPALRPLAEQGHEVIIVDNAPRTSQTAELTAQYPFRYVREPNIGLNNARNCGLRVASHPIVAYTDDDAMPDPGWADAIARAFADPEVGCVTGLVMPAELETPAQEQFEVYCAHRRAFTREVYSASRLRPAAAGVAGMGANMAFRRDALLRLGGFDPRLDGGTPTCSGGDTELFARVIESGARIVYEPEALIWHRHRRSDAQLRQCLFGYGVGLYSFLTKRLVEAKDGHAGIIAARWFVGPFIKAARRRLRGQPAMPLSLLLLEAWGACLGPWRFWQATVRHRASQSQLAPLGENLRDSHHV
jgi:GT2 family glycosyltransferase